MVLGAAGSRTAAPSHGVSIRASASAKKGGAGTRAGFLGSPAEQLVEQTRPLGRQAQALVVDGIETAHCVAKRKQPERKFFEPVEMRAPARRKAEASYLTQSLGALNVL